VTPACTSGPAPPTERFDRAIADELLYASSQDRADAIPEFPHTNNHDRGHTALNGQPPITYVNNPAASHT
jgi:hypothetical protein